jgi:hypothetical protein
MIRDKKKKKIIIIIKIFIYNNKTLFYMITDKNIHLLQYIYNLYTITIIIVITND